MGEWDAMGFHNHFFLPCGGESETPILCIWETKHEATEAEFQDFIDSEKGPGAGKTFENRVTLAAPASATPPSFFEAPSEAVHATTTSGAFFWIDHTFKSTDAAAAFWKFMTETGPEEMAKMNADWDAMGFHNHVFLPSGGDGRTICIWESKRDITAEEFQVFMDSEKAPGGGVTFHNEVHKVCLGSKAPAAYFTAQEKQEQLFGQDKEQLLGQLLGQDKEEHGVVKPPASNVATEAKSPPKYGACFQYCLATEAENEIVVPN